MNETPMTHEQFIDDTVAHYGENPLRRYVIIGIRGRQVGCSYTPNDPRIPQEVREVSEGCAVGRYMTPEQKDATLANGDWYSQLDESLRPAALLHFSDEFVSAVQSLHDEADYWTKDGLSLAGEKYVAELKKRWVK